MSDSPETLEGRAETLADRFELDLLVGNSRAVGAGELRERLTGSTGAQMAEMALNVMERRKHILADLYPYQVKAVGIRRLEASKSLAYDAMLLMSQRRAPFRSDGSLARAAKLFEQVTVLAMKRLLGPSSEAIRFAFPSEEGRPPNFPDAVRWLSDRMGMSIGAGFRPPRRQDGGVDVVAWRRFPDGQPGFPIFLTQCTLERDFVHKSRDIDLRVWAGWLRFDVDPVCVLAIPYTVESAEDWLEMAARVIVLDRLRLVGLLADDSPPSELEKWVSDEIEAYAAHA